MKIVYFLCIFFFGFLNSREIQNTHLKYESDSVSDFILYEGFVVKYNYAKKVPKFTIHELSPEQIDESGIKARRKSSFMVENNKVFNRSANNHDYKYSGYDRGHLVPAGDFYSDQKLKDETFTYINVCPQNPRLNRGLWAHIENKIRQEIKINQVTGCVITGTIFGEKENNYLGDSVGIPSYLFKILYIPDRAMYAFMCNNLSNSYVDLNYYSVSVDNLEAILNEDFFDKLNDTLEAKLESKIIYLLHE